MYFDDFMDLALLTICAVGGAALLALFAFGGVEAVQSVRARNAVFACEASNREAVRKTLSAEVACRSRTLGADTLNVKVAS